MGLFHAAREYLTPVLAKSQFLEKGVLTPEEFVLAGDFLIRMSPAWSWEAGAPGAARPYLPAGKQFLVARRCPCYRRVSSLASDVEGAGERLVTSSGDAATAAAGGDAWLEPLVKAYGPGGGAGGDEDDDDGAGAAAVDLTAATTDASTASSAAATGGAHAAAAAPAPIAAAPAPAAAAAAADDDDDDYGDLSDYVGSSLMVVADAAAVPTTTTTAAAAAAAAASSADSGSGGGSVARGGGAGGVGGSAAAAGTSSTALTAVVPVRTYDLSITYDNYYRTPRVYLKGSAESGAPLTPDQMMGDVYQDYAAKTATIEAHPLLPDAGPHISIHPCRHAQVMKRILDSMTTAAAATTTPATTATATGAAPAPEAPTVEQVSAPHMRRARCRLLARGVLPCHCHPYPLPHLLLAVLVHFPEVRGLRRAHHRVRLHDERPDGHGPRERRVCLIAMRPQRRVVVTMRIIADFE